jgi:chromosomal replication initiation ATPase DnaA
VECSGNCYEQSLQLIELIKLTVSNYYGISVDEVLLGGKGERMLPKRLAIYLAFEFTPLTAASLCKILCCSDVYKILRRTEEMLDMDAFSFPELKAIQNDCKNLEQQIIDLDFWNPEKCS